MSSWRDDLPPIPTERIRAEAIREGTRRRENRQRRQRNALVGGVGVAAVALIVVSGVLTGTSNDNQDAATADTSAADDTQAAADAASTEAPAGTAAAAATEAPEPAATEAPAEETTAPEPTAVVDYTTIGGPNAQVPPSGGVSVVPAEIFEQPPTGPGCGPSTFEVTFQRQGQAPRAPIVHWETSGVTGEAPMVVDGDVARATIGPFAPETLDEGVSYEILVFVTDIEVSGDEVFRSPPVVLRDCSP
jgi:hypothetical protein